MTETSLIGLVGGLGPAATVHYYTGLVAECERYGVQLRLIVNHADVRRVLDAASRGAIEELAEYLGARMDELSRAGASPLAIAAVTPHMCMPRLVSLIQSPIVDVIDVLNRELRRRNIDRVALMGTRQTIVSRLFGRLEATAVDLSPSQAADCHELYVSIVQNGHVSDEVTDGFAALATSWARELDVQAIVLAGTELALVPKDAWGGLQIIDCAELHIRAIVARARKDTRPSSRAERE